MVAEANTVVEHIPAADALGLVEHPDVQFIDLRDVREVHREGHIPGDYHCPRGMLEFWLDPTSEYAKSVFQQDKKYVFYCAAGMRSALAARTAQEMGLRNVAHIEDGFAGWRAAGGPVKERLRIL
ncbi:rhodanese-like domain-containing protein [Pontivivens ytuae]|uniref:Rhodanese-like domain-containing protein n=2 Tax=Pontivivens ytuae TaxID=2789856 RepID=A0A7S9LVG6_9RHOB|nr:rhodanese-like domain-containing protein [Pontivivens ytuae]QPH56071.1 rhodanese-like domain-containing protein [Pontivivens ytuae]